MGYTNFLWTSITHRFHSLFGFPFRYFQPPADRNVEKFVMKFSSSKEEPGIECTRQPAPPPIALEGAIKRSPQLTNHSVKREVFDAGEAFSF